MLAAGNKRRGGLWWRKAHWWPECWQNELTWRPLVFWWSRLGHNAWFGKHRTFGRGRQPIKCVMNLPCVSLTRFGESVAPAIFSTTSVIFDLPNAVGQFKKHPSSHFYSLSHSTIAPSAYIMVFVYPNWLHLWLINDIFKALYIPPEEYFFQTHCAVSGIIIPSFDSTMSFFLSTCPLQCLHALLLRRDDLPFTVTCANVLLLSWQLGLTGTFYANLDISLVRHFLPSQISQLIIIVLGFFTSSFPFSLSPLYLS